MQLILIALSLFLLGVSSGATAKPWVYYDIRNSGNQFLLERNPNRSAWMDSEGGVEFCEKADKMLCFKVGAFQFAIPKKIKMVGDEWRHEGALYKLVQKGRRNLLGKTYLIYIVDSQFERYKLRFLFSAESGLIAITTTDPTPGLFLLLDGACGFGAPPSCYNSR